MSPSMFDSSDNNSPCGRAAALVIKGHNLYFAPSMKHLEFWWGHSGKRNHNRRWGVIKTYSTYQHDHPSIFHFFLCTTVDFDGLLGGHWTLCCVPMPLCSRRWNKQMNYGVHSDLMCTRAADAETSIQKSIHPSSTTLALSQDVVVESIPAVHVHAYGQFRVTDLTALRMQVSGACEKTHIPPQGEHIYST